ncbi:MAG: hypothetical protein DSZ29_07500, partial [Aquificaceae bacterium]
NTAQAVNRNAPIFGEGIRDWMVEGNKVISPPIRLVSGNKNELNVSWKFHNISRNRGSFFRIYAIDSRGGRKLLLNQLDADIAEVGQYEQLFVENLNRYVGPPIQLMFQVRGLQAEVSSVKF